MSDRVLQQKYSIILRTYNETDALRRSIDSVLAQTYSDWELVIVDDGSGEETCAIIDSYIKNDSRIRAVHQDNKGGLGAMWRGIKEAKGKYLAFIDAGDEYELDFLCEINKRFEDNSEEPLDMVVIAFKEIFADNEEYHSLVEREIIYDARELIRLMERTTSFFGMCLRVTAKEKFNYTDEEELFYDEIGKSANYGDDLYLLSPVLRNCDRICVMDKSLYRYVYNENSLSHGFKEYTWQDAWNRNRLMEFTYKTYSDCGYMDDEIENDLCSHAVGLLMPCVKYIVGHNLQNDKIQQIFRANTFFEEKLSRFVGRRFLEYGVEKYFLFFLFKQHIENDNTIIEIIEMLLERGAFRRNFDDICGKIIQSNGSIKSRNRILNLFQIILLIAILLMIVFSMIFFNIVKNNGIAYVTYAIAVLLLIFTQLIPLTIKCNRKKFRERKIKAIDQTMHTIFDGYADAKLSDKLAYVEVFKKEYICAPGYCFEKLLWNFTRIVMLAEMFFFGFMENYVDWNQISACKTMLWLLCMFVFDCITEYFADDNNFNFSNYRDVIVKYRNWLLDNQSI